MKITRKLLTDIHFTEIANDIFKEDVIFFDIETTGFSPARTSLYLIGCATRDQSGVCITQFLAEQKEEQSQILSEFMNLLSQYQTIITFNGLGFDIPYLKAKCHEFKIPEQFDSFHFIDIFKSVSKLKFLLNLPNYKQKTIESFLDIDRKDTYTGGELIEIYHNYCLHPENEALQLLLLHNYEDVLGMLDLLPVLSYGEFFCGNYQISDCQILNDDTVSKSSVFALTIHLKYAFPQEVSCQLPQLFLQGNQNEVILSIPVYTGELHFFYDNYKDYYYLPAEDVAIHKSVAAFVDKEFREKAKASNCYTRKEGRFLPQFESLITPEFKESRNDKISYFELTNEWINSGAQLHSYIQHLLYYVLRT